jgi:hypothetical protein
MELYGNESESLNNASDQSYDEQKAEIKSETKVKKLTDAEAKDKAKELGKRLVSISEKVTLKLKKLKT